MRFTFAVRFYDYLKAWASGIGRSRRAGCVDRSCRTPADPSPTPCNLPVDLLEIAERICQGSAPHDADGPDYNRVVHMALNHLREDLESERGPEVIEEIRREIAYRQWCEDVVRPRAEYVPGRIRS